MKKRKMHKRIKRLEKQIRAMEEDMEKRLPIPLTPILDDVVTEESNLKDDFIWKINTGTTAYFVDCGCPPNTICGNTACPRSSVITSSGIDWNCYRSDTNDHDRTYVQGILKESEVE